MSFHIPHLPVDITRPTYIDLTTSLIEVMVLLPYAYIYIVLDSNTIYNSKVLDNLLEILFN